MPSTHILVDVTEEARRVGNEAKLLGILLRMMGGTAIVEHCPDHKDLFKSLGRTPKDLDFVTYGKFRGKLEKFFIGLGYRADRRTSFYFGESRHRYFDDANDRVVDVFFDKLAFCHTINLVGRLDLDSPTIALSDLFLGKMQIVEINEKDIKDTVIMLREHEIGEGEKECVNSRYIAKLLSDDWGFYYTLTMNLGKVKAYLDEFPSLTDDDRQNVRAKIDVLLAALENEPKSTKWKLRARVGTRRIWYTKVEPFTN